MAKKLIDLTVSEASAKLRQKELSAVELTRAYLEQIQTSEAEIGAYITLTAETAIQQAQSVDDRRAAGEELSPLAGIPMGVKDNICTEGIPTTCASRMLQNFVPPYSATAYAALQELGAVLLGKTNLDEFAMGSTTEHSYFKATHNPAALDRAPGGSSGGSAAAVGAKEAAYTLGSDTGGSIRQPAAFCGVVGMKPTYGTVSRYGLVAFASSLDQIGPLTKDVRDSALILNALAFHDPKDSTSLEGKAQDFTAHLEDGAKGLRIALPREYFMEGATPEIKAATLAVAKAYEQLGATVEEVSFPTLSHALPAYYVLSSAEASSNLARYDGVRYGFRAQDCHDLDSLYERTRSEGFGPEVQRRILLGSYVLSSGYYDAYYKKAMQVRTLVQEDFSRIFQKYDLILSPVSPTTAYPLGQRSADPTEIYLGDIYTVPANIAGVPALSFPCGKGEGGLPIGVQLIGASRSEGLLYRAAYAYEQAQKEGNAQ